MLVVVLMLMELVLVKKPLKSSKTESVGFAAVPFFLFPKMASADEMDTLVFLLLQFREHTIP